MSLKKTIDLNENCHCTSAREIASFDLNK